MCESILSFHILYPHRIIADNNLTEVRPEMIAALENLVVEGDITDENDCFVANPTAVVQALNETGKKAQAEYWEQFFAEHQTGLIRASIKDARMSMP